MTRRRLTLLFCGGALLALSPYTHHAHGANYRLGKHYGGDFTLTDHEGRQFSLTDARGQVVLIHFGFTACGSTCPATMTKVTAALERLGARASLVTPLLVSVDTKRDTPAVLKAYVSNFHPRYVGLTGTQRQVEAVARQYRAPVHVHEAGGQQQVMVDHGSGLYMVAQDGMLADILFYQSSPQDVAARIAGLLDEGWRKAR